MKGKTDINGYMFKWVNCSLSVRYLFEGLKNSVQSIWKTVQTVCISVWNILGSVRSFVTSIWTVLTSFRTVWTSVWTVFASICQLEVSILFICSKEENCSRGFSTDIQYSGWNVTIHISMTKLWDKWLTQLSFWINEKLNSFHFQLWE